MKKIVLILSMLVIVFLTHAQAPSKFKYQAVIRDASGSLKSNQKVDLTISILSGSQTGTVVYSEEHLQISTNAYGLVSLNIGEGTNKSGDMVNIDWSGNSYWLSIEMKNGVSWVPMGSSQLLSVPYAMYSNKAGSTNMAVNSYSAGTGIDINKSNVITNTAPDQVVSFTGTGISVTGAYPNFTLTNSSPNANHTGDANGAGVIKVIGIQGNPVKDIIPSNGNVLKWDESKNYWVPSPDNNTVYKAGTGIDINTSTYTITNTAPDKTITITSTDGSINVSSAYPSFDISNSAPNMIHDGDVTESVGSKTLKVVRIQGQPVVSTTPTDGQIMKYNGTAKQWELVTDHTIGNGLLVKGGKLSVDSINAFVCSAYNAYVVSGAVTLSRNPSFGSLKASITTGNIGTIMIPIDVPYILNGINKKVASVTFIYQVCTMCGPQKIDNMRLLHVKPSGPSSVIVDDPQDLNSGVFGPYLIGPFAPVTIEGHLELEIKFTGDLEIKNVLVGIRD